MPISLLIGLGGGLASALLFYSAAHGALLLGTLLLVLTPLPSLLVGLGWGWLPAAAGAVAGALLMGLLASPPLAAGYFLALGLPVGLIPYLAYLSRPEPQNPATRQWYPPGRLLAAVSLYGGALPVVVLPLIGGSYEPLRAPMGEFFRVFSARAPELGMKPLDERQIEALSEFVVTALPGALAAYWTAIFALNLYLAGRIVRASGRLARDWPDLAALAYPPWLVLLAALAVAASFTPGITGVAGASFTGALLFAYLVAGLALMHAIARGRGQWLLWIVYLGLVIFGPYMGLALTVAGLLEPALKLSRRLGPPPGAS
jgi:Predicted membrane protein (DUF2232)